jgi:hypothetical protein
MVDSQLHPEDITLLHCVLVRHCGTLGCENLIILIRYQLSNDAVASSPKKIEMVGV